MKKMKTGAGTKNKKILLRNYGRTSKKGLNKLIFMARKKGSSNYPALVLLNQVSFMKTNT